MPSLDPTMNLYLEGYLWSDVHSALSNKIHGCASAATASGSALEAESF
ncbi:MAG: hypothetical protein CLLPBCKN_006582 [Chroococcidiopsis cubana SAG 39.79]|nr:hypothetical protein [Chroococcidiopsis cubana]MDZ4877147.1 hypothetical protein [Chroococcidiopsis cubana SAG 39.79]